MGSSHCEYVENSRGQIGWRYWAKGKSVQGFSRGGAFAGGLGAAAAGFAGGCAPAARGGTGWGGQNSGSPSVKSLGMWDLSGETTYIWFSAEAIASRRIFGRRSPPI